MGAVSFDALLRSLKQGSQGGPREAGRGAVYYLHGDEEVLKDEAIRALVDRALEPGTHDFNFDQRSAADLEPQTFHTLVNTPPMLAARRAVVIRGLEDLKKASKVRQELVRYLGAPNPSTLLILVQGAGDPPDPELARAATTVAAEPLAPARVHQWVADRAARLPLALAPDAAEQLVRAVGHDLGALAQELEKLAGGAARPTAARAGGDDRRPDPDGTRHRAPRDGAGASGARRRRTGKAGRTGGEGGAGARVDHSRSSPRRATLRP